MLDDPFRTGARAGWLPRRVRVRPIAWVPGEMFVSVHIDLPPGTDPLRAVALVREEVARILGEQLPIEPTRTDEPALAVPTGNRDEYLVFVPVTLARTDPATMRVAIGRLNRLAGEVLGDNIRLLAATPNWFGAAQYCCGGSPASQPLPTEPFGGRVRYAPELHDLDLVGEAEAAIRDGARPVQVAVLDTAPEPADLRWAMEHFLHNRHLRELINRLVPPIGGFDPSPLEHAREVALQRLDQNGGFRPIEPAHPFDIRDHGLFIAGVVHAAAPWAPLRLIRVLNNFGVGSLHTLCIGLVGLLQSKPVDAPLVVNLSLGILPALEQLGSIWFGLPVEGLPGCPEDASLHFIGDTPVPPERLAELLKENDPTVTAALDLLQAPVRSLMEVLQAQNCLVVAATGNDSVYRGVDRRPRWNPRLPSLYDTTLGVAADTVRPADPARYSNRGETPSAPVRDAVSTLGGNLAADGVSPAAGVIGVYTAEEFPPLLPPALPLLNRTGWAEWSGTSFATPIMAGIAANAWLTHPGASGSQVLSDINAAARAGGRADVQGLEVPGVPVRLIWLP